VSEQENKEVIPRNTILQLSTPYTDPLSSQPNLLNHRLWCHLENILKTYREQSNRRNLHVWNGRGQLGDHDYSRRGNFGGSVVQRSVAIVLHSSREPGDSESHVDSTINIVLVIIIYSYYYYYYYYCVDYSDGVGGGALSSVAWYGPPGRLLNRLHVSTSRRLLTTRPVLVSAGSLFTELLSSFSHRVSHQRASLFSTFSSY